MGPILRLRSSIVRDPILLSHHPLCGKFDDHVFKIRGRHVCIGCTTVYPSAVVAAVILIVSGQTSFGIVFPVALLSFAVNLTRLLVRSHRFSVLFNACLGVSLSASILSAFHAPEGLQLPIIIVGLSVAFSFSLLKGYRVFAVCKSCERYGEFPSCHLPRPSRPAESPRAVSERGLMNP